MIRRFRLLLLAVLALCLGLGATGTAGAQPSPPAAPPGTAQVAVVHGIPGVPVDVYVDGQRILRNFQPATVSPTVALPAGRTIVAVTAVDAPVSDPIVRAEVGLEAGTNVSVVARLNLDGTPGLQAFVNDVSDVGDGQARATARHVAAVDRAEVLFYNCCFWRGTSPLSSGESYPPITLPESREPYRAGVTSGVLGIDSRFVGTANLQPYDPDVPRSYIVYLIGSEAEATLAVVLQVIDLGPATPPLPPADDKATLTFVHGIEGTKVDVYLNRTRILRSVEPETVSRPLPAPLGAFDLAIVPPDEGLDDAIAVTRLSIRDDASVSAAAGFGRGGRPRLFTFTDPVSPAEAGRGRVALRNVANAPSLKLILFTDGATTPTATIDGVANGRGRNTEVANGAYNAVVGRTSDGQLLIGPGRIRVSGDLTVAWTIGSAQAGNLKVILQKTSLRG